MKAIVSGCLAVILVISLWIAKHFLLATNSAGWDPIGLYKSPSFWLGMAGAFAVGYFLARS